MRLWETTSPSWSTISSKIKTWTTQKRCRLKFPTWSLVLAVDLPSGSLGARAGVIALCPGFIPEVGIPQCSVFVLYLLQILIVREEALTV